MQPVKNAGDCGGAGVLAVFFGMTASGKSTIGQAFAQHRQAPYYNTDRVRKELAGLEVSARRPDGIGQGIYSPELTALTYAAMLDRAREDFIRGAKVVVLDGSYSRREDREQVRELAKSMGVRPIFFWCACSEAETQRRLTLRAQDPMAVSDGRWEIYLHQRTTFVPLGNDEAGDSLLLETGQTVAAMLAWLAALPVFQG